jgi:hypothetical protein
MRILVLLIVAVVSAFAGYWLGFRQAWDLSLMANAPVRGSIAVAHLKSLDNNRLENVRASLDADIDTGLVLWSEVEEAPLSGALNLLSGERVLPDHLQYVRRVASYRKRTPRAFPIRRSSARCLSRYAMTILSWPSKWLKVGKRVMPL